MALLARRTGRAEVPIVLLALVLLAGVAVALKLVGEPEQTTSASPAARASGDAPGQALSALDGTGAAARQGGLEVGFDLEYKDMPRSFEGSGHLTGIVEVIGGRPFPDEWKLVIEPSKFGTGREHAEYRERVFDGNERTFEEVDLPLGGYTVRAEADGLNARPQEVLLFAIPGTPTGGKTRVHLILHLTPVGFMDGSVRDAAGGLVADLPVILEDLADRSQRKTTTSGAGVWRFDELRDGRYKLYYGSVERPLIPAESVNYMAPQRRMLEVVVPVTGSVLFKLHDERGFPVTQGRIRGFGRPGGHVACESDVMGEAVARFMPAGRYQIKVDGPDGLEGKANFELEVGEELRPVEILMRQPKR